MNTSLGPIILFDAQCVLCCVNARFVLRFDRKRLFRLASMQGPVGAELFRSHGIDPADPDTILVIDGGHALRDSDAVIAIYSGIGWPWKIVALARLIPKPLRDRAYLWIARNRYRLFGRCEICWVPSPEDRERLL